MIPLHKLTRLPPAQGLRKTVKIFEEAERRFILKGLVSENELLYLTDILDFWIPRLPNALGVALGKALDSLRETLKRGVRETSESGHIRRALNTARHLLRGETGQCSGDWDFVSADSPDGLDPGKRRVFWGMEVYLEDIRSPFNVGAMFRAAESFGAERLSLSPFCADPCHPRAQRTAMGCVSVLPWSRFDADPFDNPDGPFASQKAFFALETGGTRLEDFPFPKRGVMIAGSEELGVSPGALAAADASLGRVSIPVYGAKGSLNVSVAFGIAMHAWATILEKSGNNMV